MKTLIALLVVLASQVSVAAINYSDYEDRHQQLIKNAVEQNCGYAGTLEQVNSQKMVNRVDQCIEDVYYTTTLKFTVSIDQGVQDIYNVIVKSELADAYDHNSKNWGIYAINSVHCYLN
jgi:hypothetical protein